MVKFFRPFLRRFEIVFRPCGVAIRALNPETLRTEYRPLLESVLFAIRVIEFVFYKMDDLNKS